MSDMAMFGMTENGGCLDCSEKDNRIAELEARLNAVLNAEFLGGENGVTPMIVSELETVQEALAGDKPE